VSVPPRVIDILSVSDGVAYLQTILNNHLRLCDAIEEVNAYALPHSPTTTPGRRMLLINVAEWVHYYAGAPVKDSWEGTSSLPCKTLSSRSPRETRTSSRGPA
jgi:hypothetical protein